ncbi:hypothetical protein [Pontibacter vulgaris]|uniref:hypothetical protein n=1 Tax=Pontibacter vulgaris TaxID=2905679 RepID=UPI001FA74F48|nr:hypothetical protein [Pontibacter vulgaris]
MKIAYTIFAFAFSMLLLTGCSNNDDEATPNCRENNLEEITQQNKKKVTIQQGITGTLTYKEGNCIPTIGPNGPCEGYSSCKEYTVKRKIIIYSYTTLHQATEHDFVYYTLDANPVLTVESDAEGFYQAILAPGSYSVFIQENGKLYAKGFDGQGGINPVRVDEDKVTNFNLQLNYSVY